MITTYIGLVAAAILTVCSVFFYNQNIVRLELKTSSLDYLIWIADMEQKEIEGMKKKKATEEKLQQNRIFQMDFKITHGSAFGGCSAICVDGRHRKGVVPLDHVMMFGKNPAGKDFTYYIEDQGLEICATDNADTLLLRSNEQTFEIREANEGRDQGVSVNEAVIRRDILYYIILESKHEISIQARKCC